MTRNSPKKDAAAWARSHGCTELAADTEIESALSAAAHRTLSFSEVDRMVCFKKRAFTRSLHAYAFAVPRNPRNDEAMTANQNKRDAPGPLKDGVCQEHYNDGTLASVGKYCKGAKVGTWKYYLRNGQLRAVGKFVGGKMSGPWKWYRENGKLMQTGSFTEEKKSGVWKRYHPNGALYDQGKFSNNQKVGEWRVYDARGKLIKTAKHKSK
ncbi:MAG: toxin-antitoxin system YwqK family antitoxin [Verrucomicrobia bacterium]|nr:toxin-antitoxin system YwqK family antitoxin [Verrucomicrobiota bacterium]